MSKQIRLLYLINILSGHRCASVATLAQRCNVSRRTIHRDIKNIELAGFPVYYNNGYRIINSDTMLSANLAHDETIVEE